MQEIILILFVIICVLIIFSKTDIQKEHLVTPEGERRSNTSEMTTQQSLCPACPACPTCPVCPSVKCTECSKCPDTSTGKMSYQTTSIIVLTAIGFILLCVCIICVMVMMLMRRK